MQIKSALSITTLLLLSVSSLHAVKFETLGYKSISMGGAAVASSSGSLATYNNPALLGKTPYAVEVSMGAGVSEYDHGAGASIKKLDDIGFIETLDKASQDVDSLTTEDRANLVEGTDVMIDMNGDTITVSPQAYVAVQIYGFGFGVFSSSDATGTAIIDQDHDQLIFDNNNGTYTKINSDGSETLFRDDGITPLDATD